MTIFWILDAEGTLRARKSHLEPPSVRSRTDISIKGDLAKALIRGTL